MIRDMHDTNEQQPIGTLEDVISVVDIVLAEFMYDTEHDQRDDWQVTAIVSGIADSLPATMARPEENASTTRSIST